jgi:hypothetical protein
LYETVERDSSWERMAEDDVLTDSLTMDDGDNYSPASSLTLLAIGK